MFDQTFARRVLVLLLASVWGCGGAGDPLPGYLPDPEVFVAESDADRIEELPGEAGGRAPIDEVLVVVADGQRATAERLATDLGGDVVGQLPELALFQLRLSTTSPAELAAALDTVRADPSVRAALPNYVGDYYDCPAQRDVRALDSSSRCPWEDTNYLQAATILEELDSEVALRRVGVGIVDSGLQADNGQFGDARVADVNARGGIAADLNDFLGHGTWVASLIGADNDGRVIDGMASMAGSNLDLLIARLSNGTVMQVLVGIDRVVDAGAKVVNLSLGYGPGLTSIAAIQDLFDQRMTGADDVLFVVASGNTATVVDGTTTAPAGLGLPNLITVGSSAPCTPETRVATHTRGAGIDIVAQGQNVPVVGIDGGAELVTGTSFAAPQVAATAALLLSVDPSLGPVQAKALILDSALPGPADASGRYLNLGRAVNQLLYDTRRDLEAVVDGDGDGVVDGAGLVAARICSASQYTIEGVGSFVYTREEEDEVTALGSITAEGTFMTFLRDGSDSLVLGCDGCAFELTTFSAMGSFVSPPPTARMPLPGLVTGEVAAEWTILDCVIEDRYGAAPIPGAEGWPEEGLPKNVRVTSTATGDFVGARLDGYDADGNPINTELMSGFEGHFSTLFVSGIETREDPTIETLETWCANGRLN